MKINKLFTAIAIISLVFSVGCGKKSEGEQTPAQSEATTRQAEAQQAPQAQEAPQEAQPQANTAGNTSSNYINKGHATFLGTTTYYSGKGSDGKGIFTYDAEKGTSSKIAEDNGDYLTTIDGTLYYLKAGNLYKVESGSRNPEQLYSGGDIVSMCASNSWIYYLKPAENGSTQLYKMMFTGTGETKMTPVERSNESLSTITYDNGKIYFTDGGGVGFISLDGKTKTYLLKDYKVEDYGIYNGNLYYVFGGKLFSIAQGGQSVEIPTGLSDIKRINIAGDKVYIVNSTSTGFIPVAGGTYTKLADVAPLEISVHGNTVFGSKGVYFYIIEADGSLTKFE